MKRLLSIILITAAFLFSGCAQPAVNVILTENMVTLASSPSPAKAGEAAQIQVNFHEDIPLQNTKVDLQIDSQGQKSTYMKAVLQSNGVFSAPYTFPKSGAYTITMHISTGDNHYSFRKQLEVN